MKNEIMYKAISELDDKLIIEAEEPVKSDNKSSNILKRLGAFLRINEIYPNGMALGLLLVACLFVFQLSSLRSKVDNVDIYIGDSKVTTEQISIVVPVAAMDFRSMETVVKSSSLNTVSVPINIYTEEQYKISIDDGLVELYDCEDLDANPIATTEENISYRGDSYINWLIDGLDKSDRHLEITVYDKSKVYLLHFDEKSSCWTICLE